MEEGSNEVPDNLCRRKNSMNSDNGEIKYVSEDKKLKPPWVEIKEPNPYCVRCKEKGSVLDGNRKERRHNLKQMHYVPCPNCSGKIKD